MVDVLVTTLMDQFNVNLMKIFKRKEIFVLFICAISFLLGIPCVLQVWTVFVWNVVLNHFQNTMYFSKIHVSKNNVSVQSGVYVFQLMDHYTAIISVILLAFVEVVVVCWLYGKNPE